MKIIQNYKIWHILLPIVGFLLFSCEQSWEDSIPDVSNIDVKIDIERADKKLINAKSKQEIYDYMRQNRRLAVDGLSLDYYPNEQVFIESLWLLAESKKSDTIQEKIDKAYGDLSALKKDLGQAFKYVKYYYPDFKVPKIYTVNTGFGVSIVLNDSILVIGLDYFLGRYSRYRPSGPDREPLPAYILRNYQPENVTHQVIKLLSRKYVKISDDQSLLNEMIAGGKTMVFCKYMQPYAPDSLIIEYTSKQINACHDNAHLIWGYFVENKLFYDATRQSKTKYIQERPFVSDISQDCPGRIGYWVGWQIVDAYMQKKPEQTLQSVMNETDHQKLFQESRYKPQGN
jgi:hypothetical protein